MNETREFPFASGRLLKIIKITNARFSVCKLYEMIAHKLGKRCRMTTIFIPENILISQSIYDRLCDYYMSFGYSKEEVIKKLSNFGPKVCDLLTGNEVAVGKGFMANEAEFTVRQSEREDYYD